MTKKQKQERFEHLSQVHALIQANRPEAIEGKEDLQGPRKAFVFAIITSVSASGLSRTMRVFVARRAGLRPAELTWYLAKAKIAGATFVSESRGMRVPGCGMDMVFHTMDCLRQALRDEGLVPETNRNADFWHETL